MRRGIGVRPAEVDDPIHSTQNSREEIAAIVEEAENARLYVSACVYTYRAIRRCVETGVHSLERSNLITAETAKVAAKSGCIAVPTLVAYDALWLEGKALGLGPAKFAKIEAVRSGGLDSLAIMREAGLSMAIGSDLLGELRKFELLTKVLTPSEIIRSATLVAASLCRMQDELGIISSGAHAALIAVNLFDDIALLQVMAPICP